MTLRKLRVAAGLSSAEVAKAIGKSPSKISRVETAENGIYLDDIEKLLDLYRITDSRRVKILDIVHHAEERGWLLMHGDDTFPEDWQTWTDLESDATAILNYEPLAIPGLLQTPDYARAVIRIADRDLTDATVDALIASRVPRVDLRNRAYLTVPTVTRQDHSYLAEVF